MADEPVAPVAVFKKRGKNKNLRKRAATPPPKSDSDDDSDAFSSSEDEAGHRVKRRKKTAVIAASSKDHPGARDQDLSATIFTADRAVPLTSSNDATKQSNWYDEDSKVIKAPSKKQPKDDELAGPDGIYKGLANQTTFIQKNPNAPDKKVGPMKAPTNIRTITVTDFAPDVCKDYKQTGFCGFGDNCKFLHAREDYKQGWQLDREWENVTKGKNMQGKVVSSADKSSGTGAGGGEDEDADEAILEKIPFACIICKESYREPIVTRCGHYFCEPCALKRYRKDPSCAACGASTNGVFNSAKRLKKLLERKRERAVKRRQAAIDAGEVVDDKGDEQQ